MAESVKKKTTTKKTTSKIATSKTKTSAVKKVTKKDENKKNKIMTLEERYDNCNRCPVCEKMYDKALDKCPFCEEKQKHLGLTPFVIIFALTFLFTIIVAHFLTKMYANEIPEGQYKVECELVSYESLVRRPKDYKGKNIKIIGNVIKVEGFDNGYSNDMTIKLDTNLFDNGKQQIITVKFKDTDYEQGFITGDLITIYGKYIAIDGNEPLINAKYIVYGN